MLWYYDMTNFTILMRIANELKEEGVSAQIVWKLIFVIADCQIEGGWTFEGVPNILMTIGAHRAATPNSGDKLYQQYNTRAVLSQIVW